MAVVKTIKRSELARHSYVPPEGSTGHSLRKSSDDDADLEWGPGQWYDQTEAEEAAGVDPADPSYPFGHVLRYGMVEGISLSSDINTPIWNSMMLVAAQNGGMDVRFPCGDWRGNFLVNTHNVQIIGEGGLGEEDQTLLRPYSTGTATVTLRFGNETAIVQKCGFKHLAVSGDDGSGNMADVAVLLDGGTVRFSASDFEIVDGVRCLDIEGGGGFPVTACRFSQFSIRHTGTSSQSRAIYMRRPSGADNFVTAIYFSQANINGPTGGYWAELDGAVELHMEQAYIDHSPGKGILLRTGSETCVFFDVNLDPGTTGAVIVERGDTSKNPGNTFLGTAIFQAGQKILLSDASEVTLPTEVYSFFKKLWAGITYQSQQIYLTSLIDPFDSAGTAPYWDLDTATGPATMNRSDLSVKTAGKGLRVAEGSNAKQGISGAMVAGTVTVNNTSVTANSRIILTRQDGGTNPGAVYVSARTAATSFTITSTNGADTGTVAYQIFEPA